MTHQERKQAERLRNEWFRTGTNEGTYSAAEACSAIGVGDPAYANCYRWENVQGAVRYTGCDPAEMPGYWREYRGDLNDARAEYCRIMRATSKAESGVAE